MKKNIELQTKGSTSAQISATGVLIIPNGTKTIKQYEYRGNDNITSVVIPRSVTKITRGAFEYCSNLCCIKGGDGLKEISIRAFNGTALEEIVLPKSLKRVREDSFSECEELISVEFEGNDTVIEEGCFSDCSKLHTVMLPIDMNVIHDDLFYGCANLDCVALSPNLRCIGNMAFMGCYHLRQLDYYSFSECHGLMFPNSVTTIGYNAFRGCSGLTHVTIPNSVTSIGWYAFGDCSGLRQITFEGLTKMDVNHSALTSCTGLITINVPGEYLETYKKMLPKELHEKLVGF